MTGEPTRRICIRVHPDDDDAIKAMAAADIKTSANKIYREIISSYVRQMEAVKRVEIDKISSSIEPNRTVMETIRREAEQQAQTTPASDAISVTI